MKLSRDWLSVPEPERYGRAPPPRRSLLEAARMRAGFGIAGGFWAMANLSGGS